MMVFAALMIARTRAGAPFGTAARPLRRIITVLPETVGVFATGNSGIEDHGLSSCGGDWFQVVGVSCGSPWLGFQPLLGFHCGCCGCCCGCWWSPGLSQLSPPSQWWCAEAAGARTSAATAVMKNVRSRTGIARL